MPNSRSIIEHLENLEMLLETLAENNVRLNFEKTEFFRPELKFVGFVLTPNEIKPDLLKIEFIQNMQQPKNVKQVQSILGLINFYTRFAKNYAEVTIPLLKLTRKGEKF